MNYKRHLIQYNDLVFDEIDMIAEDDSSASFKTFSQEYGFAHGSYSPYKVKGGLLRSSSVSATITLRMKKMPCEYRPFYREFAIGQLTTQGKLWAVQNDTLVWAYAHVDNIRESQRARNDTVELDVDWTLPEGAWHKADKMKTFLVPYDKCDFMDCYDFKDIQPCFTGDCCHCGNKEAKYCNCDCNDLTKDMALCYQMERGCCKDGLQMFYACDGAGYRIVYNCAAADKFFGDFLGEHMGQKFCANCGPIAGILYSATELPTKGVKVTLHGKVTNPYIEINGNGNTIKGEYDGILEINHDGSVYFTNGCGSCDPLPVGNWVVPQGMDYGWTVEQGNNRFIVEGTCCGTVCAYVEIDELTI